eukprot:1668482-Pyramimonas_sp.AAC.1
MESDGHREAAAAATLEALEAMPTFPSQEVATPLRAGPPPQSDDELPDGQPPNKRAVISSTHGVHDNKGQGKGFAAASGASSPAFGSSSGYGNGFPPLPGSGLHSAEEM